MNEDLARDAHMFDGDGMLCGVFFRKTANDVQPEFVNQFVLADVLVSSLTSISIAKTNSPKHHHLCESSLIVFDDHCLCPSDFSLNIPLISPRILSIHQTAQRGKLKRGLLRR